MDLALTMIISWKGSKYFKEKAKATITVLNSSLDCQIALQFRPQLRCRYHGSEILRRIPTAK